MKYKELNPYTIIVKEEILDQENRKNFDELYGSCNYIEKDKKLSEIFFEEWLKL